jgi:hypothetical protein
LNGRTHPSSLWRLWGEITPEELQRFIEQRRRYLFAAYCENRGIAQEILECPHCLPGLVLSVASWPSWFRCLSCDHVCVMDKDSHLTRGAGEMVFIEKLEGLAERYTRYRNSK